MPTLKQLRYLVAVADLRHFGLAAKRCHVTQSTLSAGLQELETVLDVMLVDRSSRRVEMTPTGEEIVNRARKVLADMDDLVLAAEAGRGPLTGRLRLGVIPTVAPFFLPSILAGLRDRFPDMQLFLREDLTERLVAQLFAGDLDVLILAFPYDHADLAVSDLMTDGFLLCEPGGRTRAKPPRLKDLHREDLLLLEDGHCLRDHVLSACKLTNRDGLNGFQATSLHTLLHMVDSGLGVTLVPQLAVDAGLLRGLALQAHAFADAAPSRTIGLAWRRTSRRGEEFQALARAIRELAAVRPAVGEPVPSAAV